MTEEQITYMAIDLELEQPNNCQNVLDSSVDEAVIIQVGWTVYDVFPDFYSYHTAQYCVKHDFNLSTHIKKLTGLTDADIQNGIPLPVIFDYMRYDFESWDVVNPIREWGFGDIDKFRRELLEQSSIDWPWGFSGCNVKHMYQDMAHVCNLSRNGGLLTCMKRLGITPLQFEGVKKHQAGVDSLNTALFHAHMMQFIRY